MTIVVPDLTGKVAVVTGATGGMGQVIAAGLVHAGARVITMARNRYRADALRARIGEGANDRIDIIAADLSRREDVVAAARIMTNRHEEIHILVNNAGAHFPRHNVSADGIEMHIAIDYLAAYGLMTLLDQPLRHGRARIVNIVSNTINDTRRVGLVGKPRPATLDLSGIEDVAQLNPKTDFVPFEAYARAKLMTVTAGYALARAFTPDAVTLNAVHPGIVATGIIDDLTPAILRPFAPMIRRRLLTPAEGAETALRFAADPALTKTTGRYFTRDIETATPPISHDLAIQQKLLALSKAHFNR